MNEQGRKDPENEHIRRVAAWCSEIAGKLNLPDAEHQALEQAAQLHHRSKLEVDDAAWNDLRRELGIARMSAQEPEAYNPVIEVLQAFHGNPPSSLRIRKLAQILEQCEDLDSSCELDASVSAEPELNGLDELITEVAGYFGEIASDDLDRAVSRLPVFDTVAYRAIAMLGNKDTNLADVESLVKADQMLAGLIVSAANSVLMNSATCVTNVRQAIARIGTEPARQIVSAASVRKLFNAKQSHTLWNHSLDVAETAADIARRSGLVDTEEAFLAGLMHDVGKLVILNLPAASLARQERLTKSGCPDPIVERVLLGVDHAAISARVLRGWRFAESTVQAVESHHTPERNTSPLSCALYLAERYAGRDPGLDSAWRDELARTTLRIANSVIELPAAFQTLTSGLRFAAAA